MNFKDFTTIIVNEFQTKKEEKQIKKERIIRGRAPSISDKFEELIAVVLDSYLIKKYMIFIDYPISYMSSSKKKKTIYPDIIIIDKNRNEIVEIIELKIDLGYLSEDWSKQSAKIFSEIKECKTVSYKTKVGNDKGEKKELSVKKNLRKLIIVLSSENAHGRLEKFTKDNKNTFILMKSHHPNDYSINKSNKKKFIDDIVNGESDWNNLISLVKKDFS